MASPAVHVSKYLSNNSICRLANGLFRFNVSHNKCISRNFYATMHLRESERDPAVLFFNEDVQKLLKKLTRLDLKKVFSKRKEGQRLEAPEYKFMTSEELAKALKDAEEEAQLRLQMPPVVLERKVIERVLSQDPALKGFDSAKHVFTDITYGVSDRDRIIVVRDSSGVLRDASWEERFRMNQLYFPTAGRKMTLPKSFENDNLKKLLEAEEYKFLLDLACVQFEPDDLDYKRITATVYDHIEENRKYDLLRSTRHFGPLAFYLAWNKRIDNLLLDVIHFERIDEAVSLIQLYHNIKHEAKPAETKSGDELLFIKSYIELDSLKKSTLELAIQTYSELLKQKEDLAAGIQRAHGY